uniref:Calcium-binding protein n=1 Tax=Desertifilum tharense IPPAS B-1220 TaxID=1781255 RepID=A0ACD5GVL3_9CYAN
MAVINGTLGDDFLVGTPEADLMSGIGGNNVIYALEGNDTVFGVPGNDYILGNQGNDLIFAGSGNDIVFGGKGDDTIFGNEGNNALFGNEGNDVIYGNQGDDVIYGNQGNDLIFAGKGNDVVYGGKDNDTIYGNEGNDVVFGNDGNDILYGNQANDTLYGGKGNDILYGGKGNDVLFGDSGADTLVGGQGRDIFVLGRRPNNAAPFLTTGGPQLTNADYILDFTDGQDLIGLEPGLSFEQLNIFQGTGQYANDTIIQDTVTGEFLAILQGVNRALITAADFTTNLTALPDLPPTPAPPNSCSPSYIWPSHYPPPIIFPPAPSPTPAPPTPEPPVNQPPTTNPFTIRTVAGQVISPLRINVTDVATDPESAVLRFDGTPTATATTGTVALSPDSNFLIYTPPAGSAPSPGLITYQVTDNVNQPVTGTINVEVFTPQVVNGANVIEGQIDRPNILIGTDGSDRITDQGTDGDTLIGGLGRDTLVSGPGPDEFVFNDPRDSFDPTTNPVTPADIIDGFNASQDTIRLSFLPVGTVIPIANITSPVGANFASISLTGIAGVVGGGENFILLLQNLPANDITPAQIAARIVTGQA